MHLMIHRFYSRDISSLLTTLLKEVKASGIKAESTQIVATPESLEDLVRNLSILNW